MSMITDCTGKSFDFLRISRNRKQIISFFIASFFLFISVNGQPYDYPIKPGTKEWKALQTHDEMIKATEIPAGALKKMNTHDLIVTCINYPLAMEYLAFDNYKKGYEKTFYNFSAFKELMSRKDAGAEFLKYMKLYNVNEIANTNVPAEKGTFIFKTSLVELMVTDKAILANMSQQDAGSLLKDLRGKLKVKDIHNEHFGSFGRYISAYALSQVLMKINKLDTTINKDIALFANSMQLRDTKVLDDIVGITDKVNQ